MIRQEGLVEGDLLGATSDLVVVIRFLSERNEKAGLVMETGPPESLII